MFELTLFTAKKWLGQLLMPLPFSLSLLLLALALLWFTRFQKTGKLLATFSLLLITLMGMRPVSYELARSLEQTYPPFEVSLHPHIDAIVVLGNGHVSDPAVPERAWQNNISLTRTLEGVRLAQAIDWDAIEQEYSGHFAAGGKVAIPARMAFGVLVIRAACRTTDSETVEIVRESPYLQYFLGFDSFTYDVPFSSRSMERFRTRISPARVREAVALLRGFETNKGSKK